MGIELRDVVVVGGGAAGLFAAIAASAQGARTLLIEKNRKIGVKILMSGGTRCNITQDTDWRGIAAAFGGGQARFLKFALASFTPGNTVEYFNSIGVSTKTESTGKIFPVSNRAIEVRDALLRAAEVAGVEIIAGLAVRDIGKTENEFRVQTADQLVRCRHLIITTGGQSYPECGTSGDGYTWLQRLGHRIVSPRPALTPIRVNEQWVRELAGITIPDTGVTIRMGGQKSSSAPRRSEDRGSFLFTHRGCSGPAVLNVSRTVTDPQFNVARILVCDWLPDTSQEQLRAEISANCTRKKTVGEFLAGRLPRRLVEALSLRSNVDFQIPLAELGRKRTGALLQQLKSCELPVAGTLGFAKAEVTAGGVSLDEVDPLSMASRLVPGLYLAGEILDIDGPIGGYNFQAAWSTGRLAGTAAAESIRTAPTDSVC